MTEAEKWITEEQDSLWSDFDDQLRNAANGVWSMAASNVARRIIGAARLVGPTDPGSIPWRLHAGGVYAAVLTAGGVPVPEFPEEQWAKWDVTMAGHGGSRAKCTGEMAATVAEIQTERETAWLNGEDE